jgi:hypothetical protein
MSITFAESRRVGPGSAIAPRLITNNIGMVAKTIRLGFQEDAHEFLAQLLDTMERHCKADHRDICTLMVCVRCCLSLVLHLLCVRARGCARCGAMCVCRESAASLSV